MESAADPAAGAQLQPPARRGGRGFAATAHSWDREDPVMQPAAPAVSSSQPQHAVGPHPPYPLSMAAFLPPELPQQQPVVAAPQPPRSQPTFAAPQPPQPSSSPGPGWGTAAAAAPPATGLSNGHGHSGSGGPFGGGLFGLGGGAFSARQPQAEPPAAAAAAAEPALYTPFGGVGSAFGAVTLPARTPDHHGLMAPPVPLQTAFGALPGSVDLQSLWQPGAVLTDGGDQSSQCVCRAVLPRHPQLSTLTKAKS